jgi:hypothetical protein
LRGRYLSGDDPAVFAAGVDGPLTIEVSWRAGGKSVISNAVANALYEVYESGAEAAPKDPAPAGNRLFRDVSDFLAAVHHDEPFRDTARQPLLARQLSQLGPGVGFIDLDADGRDELVVGDGRGGALRVYYRNSSGAWIEAGGTHQLQDDTCGLALWTGADGRTGIMVALASYETESGSSNACIAPAPDPEGWCLRQAAQPMFGRQALGRWL